MKTLRLISTLLTSFFVLMFDENDFESPYTTRETYHVEMASSFKLLSLTKKKNMAISVSRILFH